MVLIVFRVILQMEYNVNSPVKKTPIAKDSTLLQLAAYEVAADTEYTVKFRSWVAGITAIEKEGLEKLGLHTSRISCPVGGHAPDACGDFVESQRVFIAEPAPEPAPDPSGLQLADTSAAAHEALSLFVYISRSSTLP